MILCHIVGVNNLTKQKFINEMNGRYENLYFCDLDIITNDIRNSKRVLVLTKAIDESKNQTKRKELVKELNDFWKDSVTRRLSAELQAHKNKSIIIMGLSTFHLNHKTKIDIATPNKYFLKVNVKVNAKEIVEYNLKTYKEYIIDGTFPIRYLDHEFLINQREKLMSVYEKMNYAMKTYPMLVKALGVILKDQPIQMGGSLSLIKQDDVTIWFSSPKRHDGQLSTNESTGYKEKWLSLLSSIKDNNKYFKKGYIDDGNQNRPYIEERSVGALTHLNQSAYLYEIKSNKNDQMNNFKYKIHKNSPFTKRTMIPNIQTYLKDNGVKIIKFKY